MNEKHQDDIKKCKEKMEEARQNKDKEKQRILEQERREMQAILDKVKADREKLERKVKKRKQTLRSIAVAIGCLLGAGMMLC